jgi:hypothetical protein
MAETFPTAVFFFVSVIAVFGQSLRTEADALLLRAEKTALYSSDEAPFPYHLRVDFILSSTPSKMQGRFIKDYLSHEQWRERYELGEYLRVGVRNGKQMGEVRSDPFQPVRLDQVRNSLPPVVIRFESADKIRKINDKMVNGIRGKCVEYDTVRGATGEENEVCVSLVDGTIMRLRQRATRGPCVFGCGLRETEWSSYTSLRGKLYPKRVVLKTGTTKIVEADVKFTEGTDLAPAAFDIPSKFERRRACDQVSPPVRIQGRTPEYPHRVGEISYGAGMLVQARVGVDGRVQDAQAVRNRAYATQPGPPLPQAGDVDMTRALMDAEETFVGTVKQWTFEPAKCDGVPVVENILIHFRVR